jgi:site-specific recombinase XerD
MDSRTKKITLSYSIPVDKGLDEKNNRIIRMKQMKMYLKNVYVDDVDVLLNNLQNYSDEILREMNVKYKTIGSDRDTIHHWKRVYTENSKRKGTLEVSPKTLSADEESTRTLIDWLVVYKPKYLNIWSWVKDGRDVLLEFFKYKQEVGGVRKKWSDGAVQSSYRRIRGFFNFISDNVEGFPPQLLNRLPVKQAEIKTETFTSMEMELVLQFLEENKDEPKWDWFVPMFKVLLETGMRVSEVVQLKIRNLDVNERKIKITGKGKKDRWIYFRSEPIWKIICNQIYDEEGKIRTDTEWVFWKKYQNVSYGQWYWLEDKTKPFSTSGIQHRTKELVRTLKLNPELSTHSTRRYYITEMLKKTNGNIPLVAQLVGHNTWDVVKRYTKNVVDENVEVNVGIIS